MRTRIQYHHPQNFEFTAAVLHLVHKFDTEADWCEEAAVRVVRRIKDADDRPSTRGAVSGRKAQSGKSVWEFLTNVVPTGRLNVVCVCV